MKIRVLRVTVILLTITLLWPAGRAQEVPASVNRMVAGIPVNYDEDKVGNYTLPDPLVMLSGKKVKNEKQWYKKRRPEILDLFYEYEYGKVPPRPEDMSFNVFDKGTPALDGKALRKQITVYFTKDTSNYKMDILIYLPRGASGPVPIFLNLSFSPNATIADDPGIRAGTQWGRDGTRVPVNRRGGFGRMNINTGYGAIIRNLTQLILHPSSGVPSQRGRGDSAGLWIILKLIRRSRLRKLQCSGCRDLAKQFYGQVPAMTASGWL
jgi:hypothetical protein